MKSIRNFSLLWLLWNISMSVSGQVYVGAAYYPDQATENRIQEDARLMREANFNLARIGDFAWSAMEPEDGNFAFGWLDNAIHILAQQQIDVLLCTPTAAIPKWMHDAYPDIMQLKEDGQRKPYGRRRHACINNEIYREYCVRIARILAERYKNSPSVIGFQIDNELATEEPYCYCPVCRDKFAGWLGKKYETVEQLNTAWGTAFWSETLTAFDQVWLPRKMDNPGAYLDYQRFNSDCTLDFFRLQRDAIKAIAPDIKITTNIGGSGFVNTIDMYKLGEECDVLAVDNYPTNCTLENNYGNNTGQPFDPAMVSFALQQIRGGRNEPIWVTEEQVGKTALVQREIVSPGIVRLWTHQQLAYGGTMSVFFPFCSFNSAHEHLMAGIVESDGIKRRKYNEVQQTAAEIQTIYAKTGLMIPTAKAAIIRDFDADWTFEVGYTFCPDIKYMREVYTYYHSLRAQSIMTDIISSSADLSNYDLIVVPYQTIVTPGFFGRLKERVKEGATVIITCLTGVRDNMFHKFSSFVESGLQELAGIEIEEQEALFGLKYGTIQYQDVIATCKYWFEKINLVTASELATFTGKYFKDSPAITYNAFGKGAVYYVATLPEQTIINRLAQDAIMKSSLQPVAKCANSLVEITELKATDGKEYVYIMNFSAERQKILLRKKVTDIITGKQYENSFFIDAMEYKVTYK